MGGFGSGRFGRRSRRLRVEEVHEFAIGRLRKAGMFDDAERTSVASFSVGHEAVRVHFETTFQPLGGLRWWFLCPRCGNRRAKLYIRISAHFPIACRECHRLRYTSQCLSMPERWRHRANVYFRRAGCRTSDSFYYKPKWMRWRTFNELIDHAEEFENLCFGYGLWRYFGARTSLG